MAKKYICLGCGNTFNEDEIGSYIELRDGGIENFSCCPYCPSTDYADFEKYMSYIIEKAISDAKGDEQDKYETVYKLFENKEI